LGGPAQPLAHQEDGQAVRNIAIVGPTAVFSSLMAVVVALRFAGDACADSASARSLIMVNAALTLPASAENAELVSLFSAVSAFSMLARSAETWPPALPFTLMSASFVSAARNAVTCAQETDGEAVGDPDEFVEEPAVLPAVALKPHAARNAMAPRPAIASGKRRSAGSRLG
jgi:hypothetical protein